MARSPLTRRDLLGALGASAWLLPSLELLAPRRAYAATQPKRFIAMYAGMSVGMDNLDPSQLGYLVPSTTGGGYTVPEVLAPLTARGVVSDCNILTGMKLPWYANGTMPPGGMSTHWHPNAKGPLMSGVRTPSGTSEYTTPGGPTADQVAAAALAGTSRFRSVELRVQADVYGYGNSGNQTLSYSGTVGGNVTANPPLVSPHVAYNALFSGLAPATSAGPTLAQRADQRIVQAALAGAHRLNSRLTSDDRMRLQRHFDELEALGQRVSSMPAPVTTCMAPQDPGADPPTTEQNYYGNTNKLLGWSNETLRAELLSEMVRLSFACDLTRVVSMLVTCPQCWMDSQPITGVAADVHELGHNGGGSAALGGVKKMLAWHVDIFARLVASLKATPDGAGNLLDNTTVALVFEGGHGYSVEEPGAPGTHSPVNMVALTAGGVGGLAKGQHIDATDVHPARVWGTLLKAHGLSDTIGEVSGVVPGLL